MAKHVLVITQYFYPEQFRINDICFELVKRGYKVTVLTGIPNYPEGKFFNGYGLRKKRRETINGVDVIRIPIISRGKSALRLVANYYSFVFSGWFWNLFTKIKADYVFTFEVSPLLQAKIGVWYANKHKVPCYLYAQDLWPDNLEVVGGIKNKLVLNHYGKMADKLYNRYDKIFAPSPSFVEEIKRRVKGNEDKVVYLPQYAEDYYEPLLKKPIKDIPDDDRFKIIFTGNIGQAQGLEILPKSAKALKEGGVGNVLFVMVGGGRNEEFLKAEIRAAGVSDMFLFIPRKPSEEIPELLSVCDAAFLSFMNNSLFEKTIPAKLQSYMACGMPIIASANGETKRIIEESVSGLCTDIGDEKALTESILKMMRDENISRYGANAKAYCNKNFNKEGIIKILSEMFN